MLKSHIVRLVFVLLAFAFHSSLHAEGLVWRFLGNLRIDRAQDHDKIQIGDRHGAFRAVQLRVSGEAIFCQRIVVHYTNGTSEELVVGNRIFPEGKTRIIDFAGDPHTLDSVEFWYFREPWEHLPRVTLYGTR